MGSKEAFDEAFGSGVEIEDITKEAEDMEKILEEITNEWEKQKELQDKILPAEVINVALGLRKDFFDKEVIDEMKKKYRNVREDDAMVQITVKNKEHDIGVTQTWLRKITPRSKWGKFISQYLDKEKRKWKTVYLKFNKQTGYWEIVL